MPPSNQLHPIPLGQVSFSAGQGATLKFDRALSQLGGRLAHVRKITMTGKATPTLTAGTVTPAELMKAVNKLIIKDNVRKLFEGSFTSLRHFEMYENGRLSTPEPDALATTEQGTFTRTYDLAMRNFADPQDFLQALATFSQGSIYFGFGALADVDSQLTALTLTIDVVVHVAILDEINMPPLLERVEQDVTKSIAVGAEALYAFVAFANSNAFDAFTAADLTELQTTCEAMAGEQVDVRCLRDSYYDDMDVGQLSQVSGEPVAATDDNAKTITGTAAAAPLANLQPIIWSPKGQRISKLIYSARSNISWKWSGSQASVYALMSRLVPRTADIYGKYLASIKLGLPVDPSTWSLKARTISKRENVGPRREYMACKLKAPRGS